MGSTICFSSATILRCTSLAPLQTVALIIPTVLEVLCSSSLIFKHKTGGRYVIFFPVYVFLNRLTQETLTSYGGGMDILSALGVTTDI